MSGRIYYFCTAKHTYAFGIYASFYARKPADRLRLIPYAALPMIRSFEPGSFIFTDHDRLADNYRQLLTRLSGQLGANGCPVLNHPTRSLQRFALLRALHDAGINRFNVHWLADWRQVERFPVFIRCERGHDEPLTGLIANREELEREAERLLADPERPTDAMIVEFGNAPAEDGRFRKYSAYRVGDQIYAQHFFSRADWWIKFGDQDATPKEKEELVAYLRDNPHRDQLRQVFEIAKIEYGRVDYCVVDGRVQVFEINTNPTVIQGGAGQLTDLTLYVRLHDDALMRLPDPARPTGRIANPLFAGSAEMDADAVHEQLVARFRANGKQTRVPVDRSLAGIGPDVR